MPFKAGRYIEWKDVAVLFLPLFFVLHEWNARFVMLNHTEMTLALICYCLITVVIYILCRLFTGNKPFAFLSCNICSFLFFFFGKFLDIFSITRFSRVGVALVISLVLLVLILRVLRKKDRLTRWLNIFYLLLFLVYMPIEVGSLAIHIINDKPRKTLHLQASTKPDVYLLVMDEYASSEALLKYFNYNNYRFDSFLVSNKFTVVPGSKSNYNFTMFSVAGMLNYRYFKNIDVNRVTDKDYLQAYRQIRNSYTQHIFEQNGYAIKNYSCFNLRGHDTRYDINIPAFGKAAIFYQTLAGRLQPIVKYYLGKKEWEPEEYREGYQERMDIFSAVKKEATQTGSPKFVYMHLLAPHPPFYTDSLGRYKASADDHKASMQKDVSSYTSYLGFCNKKLEDMISTILTNSRGEAVIILMGDHGLRKYGLTSPSNEHHFMNMMAVYLPARYQSRENIPKTPVNLFPYVLNSVFNAGIPYQGDSSFFLSLKAPTVQVSDTTEDQ